MRGYVATATPLQTSVKQCTSCGATAEFPAGAISATCSYCAAPLVDGERGEMAVDRVAPFRITRPVAQEKLKQHLRGKFWAPTSIRRGVLQDHRLRGVLVPFFAYNGIAHSQYAARVGMYYYRTETYRDSNGKTRTRMKRETEWFSHQASAVNRLQDHLVSASKGLPEQESNDLEPFDLGHALSFDRSLLAGWEAELPNIDFARADHVARQEVTQLEAARIEQRLLFPGDTGSVSSVNTNISIEKRRRASTRLDGLVSPRKESLPTACERPNRPRNWQDACVSCKGRPRLRGWTTRCSYVLGRDDASMSLVVRCESCGGTVVTTLPDELRSVCFAALRN